VTHSAIRPAFLADFKCLGADCEDTCCKGWGMQVDNHTRERYQREAPDLMDAVVSNDGHCTMRRNPQTNYCVKFENGLCGIQLKHGEDFLGDACYFYPRTIRALGNKITMTATLSCPEIARLALFGEEHFSFDEISMERLPETLHDYKLKELTTAQALTIHQQFLAATTDKSTSAEHHLMRIFVTAEMLSQTPVSNWPESVSTYLQRAAMDLPEPEPHETDPVYLLQALCGLVAAAKNLHQSRLMETIEHMQRAMHVTIPWDSLMIASLPDHAHVINAMTVRWQNEWQFQYADVLRHYVTMQLSLATFPFAGFGHTLTQRIAIIGVRLATVKLALMCAASISPTGLTKADVVRIIQSLSRFLDHLADPEFSLKIYQETGWLQKRRLRALLGDR